MICDLTLLVVDVICDLTLLVVDVICDLTLLVVDVICDLMLLVVDVICDLTLLVVDVICDLTLLAGCRCHYLEEVVEAVGDLCEEGVAPCPPYTPCPQAHRHLTRLVSHSLAHTTLHSLQAILTNQS